MTFSLYFERSGQGADLVFLHGYTCSLEHWRWIANQLSRSYRVLLFDMRCHGRSGIDSVNLNLDALVEETRQFLLELQIEHPVLIGHSMGGMAALEYALRWPQAVRALVLAEAHTHLQTTAYWLGSAVQDAHTPPGITGEIQSSMSRGARTVSPELFESLRSYDARERLSSLVCPVLCLWGDRYGDISTEQWPQILEAFGYAQVPNLSFRCIPNSHHFVMLEQPQQMLNSILEFLTGL